MLRIEKIKFNINNLVHFKHTTRKIKSASPNNNKEGNLPKAVTSVPSLKDMEFNWIEDY